MFWKLGWSKAPADEKCCTVIAKSYELHDEEDNVNNEEGTADEAEDQNIADSWIEDEASPSDKPLLGDDNDFL